MTIESKLDELKALDDKMAGFQEAIQVKIDEVLTPEIKAKLQEIEVSFQIKSFRTREEKIDLEREIKTVVLASGASVKGDNYHLIYSKGRITWDTKALNGYLLAHPEISELRKTGKPSVRIKRS